MENKPKVTIQIPVYNNVHLLGQAIDSALSQTYQNLEILVVDDCSTDDIDSAVTKYKDNLKFKYIRNTKNLGRVANYRNILFNIATGDYVLNLDGDDYLKDNNYISDAIELIVKNKLDFVFARQKVLFERDNTLVEDKINTNLFDVMDGNELFLNFYKGVSVPHLSTLYNRNKAMDTDYYAHDLLSADMESMLKLMINNKVGYINKFVGVWRKHQENASRKVSYDELKNNASYIENVYQYAINEGHFNENQLKTWRLQMLKRYFVKNILRAFISKETSVNDLLDHIKDYDTDVYRSIKTDKKIKLLLILGKNDFVLKFVFKHVLKMESMLKDYEEVGKN